MKKTILLVLALFFMFGLVGCETNYEKEKVLMERGPWSSKAIWVDENSQMYLICSKDNSNKYADVVAYWFVNEQWCSAQLHLYQGAPIVWFVTEDDHRVLEARAYMNDHNLLLYEFKAYDESCMPQYNEIELLRFSYQEMIDELPFEISR